MLAPSAALGGSWAPARMGRPSGVGWGGPCRRILFGRRWASPRARPGPGARPAAFGVRAPGPPGLWAPGPGSPGPGPPGPGPPPGLRAPGPPRASALAGLRVLGLRASGPLAPRASGPRAAGPRAAGPRAPGLRASGRASGPPGLRWLRAPLGLRAPWASGPLGPSVLSTCTQRHIQLQLQLYRANPEVCIYVYTGPACRPGLRAPRSLGPPSRHVPAAMAALAVACFPRTYGSSSLRT